MPRVRVHAPSPTRGSHRHEARNARGPRRARHRRRRPARAQLPGRSPDHHLLRIGFGGGASVPTSRAADAFKTGVNGEGFLLVDLGLGLPALRFNLAYQRFDYKDALLNGGSGQSTTLSGVGGLTLPLFHLGPLHPYLTAGVGAFDLEDSFTAAASAGAAPSTSSIRFGVDGGGGLGLKLGRLEAFVEGRVQNIYTDEGAIDAKSIQSIPVSFGILF